MNATLIPPSPSLLSPVSSPLLRKFGPLAAIIALHVAFFYALQSGLLHHPVVKAAPKEIIAHLITLEPAPAPKPQLEPKTVPVVKKTVTPPKLRPTVTPKPSPQAITETAPPPPQASQEPPAAAPAAPATPATPAPPKTISGVAYINAPRPSYPPLDARMGNEGTVTLRVLINEKGRAEKVEVQKSSGSLRMDDSARDAVLRALFKPYLEDGKAIPVYAIVPINFTLNK